ncbi:MAG: Maf family protein, partial [Mogibacterium sp.]|nr:Maf family protein [Mogibacterium sp.]
ISMSDAVILLSGIKAAASEADPRTQEILSQPGALPALVIAADTVVYKEYIMGKPSDYQDAFHMLDAIRGTYHDVATGVTLLHYTEDQVETGISGNCSNDSNHIRVSSGAERSSEAPETLENKHKTPVVRSFCEVTRVWCKPYTDADIDRYIQEESPYDKAGSYAIQSSFAEHIDHIEGDYENVVGLPFERIVREIAAL